MYAAKEPEEARLWDSGSKLNIKMKNIETADNLKWTNDFKTSNWDMHLPKTNKCRKCNREGGREIGGHTGFKDCVDTLSIHEDVMLCMIPSHPIGILVSSDGLFNYWYL